MYKEFNINNKIIELSKIADDELESIFKNIDKNSMLCSGKVLKAFQEERVDTSDFNEITGYGYSHSGRDKLERVFARVFKAEDALVRPQIMSGTHALTLCLTGLLRHGDTFISISGEPYDSLRTVIGIDGDIETSLINNGIKYEQIDLIDDDFDYDKIIERMSRNDVRLIEIQRSVGYSNRKSICISKIEKVIKKIREVNNNVIILVDNCYGEFVEDREPIEVGADVIASSFMKNLGAGIATSGGYIVGSSKCINLIADRLTVPGVGKNLGVDLGTLLSYYKGLFFSPSVVASALKTMVFASYMLEKLGYKVSPKYNEQRTDIIEVVELGNEKDLIEFCQGLQKGGPIESNVIPIPSPMPGYPFDEIMAGASFTPSATIELSADGPLTPPYKAFMQGSLTYEYGKLGIMIALSNLTSEKE